MTDMVAIKATPAIVGEAVGLATFDDFSEDVRDILVVVRAVDAENIEDPGPIGIAVYISGKPIWMCLEERFAGTVGIHSGYNSQPLPPGRCCYFSK